MPAVSPPPPSLQGLHVRPSAGRRWVAAWPAGSSNGAARWTAGPDARPATGRSTSRSGWCWPSPGLRRSASAVAGGPRGGAARGGRRGWQRAPRPRSPSTSAAGSAARRSPHWPGRERDRHAAPAPCLPAGAARRASAAGIPVRRRRHARRPGAGRPAGPPVGRRAASSTEADRDLYHLGATLAAGGVTTLLAAAERIRRAGLPPAMVAGYVELARGAVAAAGAELADGGHGQRGDDRPGGARRRGHGGAQVRALGCAPASPS